MGANFTPFSYIYVLHFFTKRNSELDPSAKAKEYLQTRIKPSHEVAWKVVKNGTLKSPG